MFGLCYSQAKIQGEPIYTGSACVVCGEKLRYTTNGACINRAGHAVALGTKAPKVPKAPTARKIAAANHLIRYEGKPCIVCGTTSRYTANGGCVACVDGRSKQFQVNKRARYISPQGLPVIWINERSKNRAELYDKIGYPDWHLAFSTTPVAHRMKARTGRDVLESIGDFATELNALLRGETSPTIELLRPLLPVAHEAMRIYNNRKPDGIDGATYTATVGGVVYSKTLGTVTRVDGRPMLPLELIAVFERAMWKIV